MVFIAHILVLCQFHVTLCTHISLYFIITETIRLFSDMTQQSNGINRSFGSIKRVKVRYRSNIDYAPTNTPHVLPIPNTVMIVQRGFGTRKYAYVHMTLHSGAQRRHKSRS